MSDMIDSEDDEMAGTSQQIINSDQSSEYRVGALLGQCNVSLFVFLGRFYLLRIIL